MEKLQAALAKAREKRYDSGAPMPGAAYAGARPSRAQQREQLVAENWAAIEQFTPSEKRMHQARIFSAEASAEAQHFDILRTKLFMEMRRHEWTRIAITSATAGCGKTTTACNLIAGMVRQPENRGILFDLDFRRPAVSRCFGASPSSSLEDVFHGDVPFSEQAMRLGDNAAIAMTTRSVVDPASVVLRKQTEDVLDDIQAEYDPDLMLFDMPPVLISEETRGFLKQVDAVLIVAGAEMSTVQQVDEVEREIARYSNVAGIVLNKCRFMEDGYGYGYRY